MKNAITSGTILAKYFTHLIKVYISNNKSVEVIKPNNEFPIEKFKGFLLCITLWIISLPIPTIYANLL